MPEKPGYRYPLPTEVHIVFVFLISGLRPARFQEQNQGKTVVPIRQTLTGRCDLLVEGSDPGGESAEEGVGLIEVGELFWGGGEGVVHALDGEVGYGDSGFG